ncbi:MAG TPA: dTDP-4-dehydrorhamnose 3,5-epimerase family protein, partial [Puia sp.]
MPFKTTDIPGLILFEPAVYKDERGWFYESYNEQTFGKQGIGMRFLQDNQSFSYYGVIRGLHYQ